ncbi:MAG: hypothetical protein NVSMB66_2720 [Candidatus Doudnabacteria bacterium]
MMTRSTLRCLTMAACLTLAVTAQASASVISNDAGPPDVRDLSSAPVVQVVVFDFDASVDSLDLAQRIAVVDSVVDDRVYVSLLLVEEGPAPPRLDPLQADSYTRYTSYTLKSPEYLFADSRQGYLDGEYDLLAARTLNADNSFMHAKGLEPFNRLRRSSQSFAFALVTDASPTLNRSPQTDILATLGGVVMTV